SQRTGARRKRGSQRPCCPPCNRSRWCIGRFTPVHGRTANRERPRRSVKTSLSNGSRYGSPRARHAPVAKGHLVCETGAHRRSVRRLQSWTGLSGRPSMEPCCSCPRPLQRDATPARLEAARGQSKEDIEAEPSRGLEETDQELGLERTRPGGRVIEVRRNAVPGGGASNRGAPFEFRCGAPR